MKHIEMNHEFSYLTILFDSRKEMTLTLCRMAEFYESVKPEINGKFFTLEQFIDSHTSSNGDCTYFSEWEGFNIPKESLDKFFSLYRGHETSRESKIKTLLHQYNPKYIIAIDPSSDISTLLHEKCHAHYSLSPMYKVRVNELLEHVTSAQYYIIKESLMNEGYSEQVIEDEIQAYFATSTDKELDDLFPDLLHLDKTFLKELFQPLLKEVL
jgi:hypothetical protein